MPNPSARKRNVTIAEAAAIAGRSTSWVRSKRDFGPLIPAVVDGRQGVELDSLLRFLALRADRRTVNRPRAPRHLRLIVDNTK